MEKEVNRRTRTKRILDINRAIDRVLSPMSPQAKANLREAIERICGRGNARNIIPAGKLASVASP